MKHKELTSLLNRLGFTLVRANKHEVWTNGKVTLTVPRHKEIGRHLAKQIVRQAERGVQ